MATHTDKDHMHNHFIVNTVNFETGEKYRQSKVELERYKEISNEKGKNKVYPISS